MVDTIIDGMVDGIDNKLLKQQINFFSEIRHAYHEFKQYTKFRKMMNNQKCQDKQKKYMKY